MKEYLSHHTLAGDAKMRREVFKGAFLFVEGPSDGRFYNMFTDAAACQIIVAHNRFNVVEACRILEAEKFPGAIGIIDADFNHLEQRPLTVSCVFQTDMYDAECFMLSTSAFDKVLSEFASPDKLSAWQAAYVTDVRNHLLQEAALIAGLLWHSNRAALNLCFGALDIKEFVNDSSLKIDISKLVRHVKNKSQRHDLRDEHLVAGFEQCIASSDKMWLRVRGHDVIDLLGFALRKTLGSWKAQDATREHIERGLRLAYAADAFSETLLFRQVRDWERANPPYRVFREIRQKMLQLED